MKVSRGRRAHPLRQRKTAAAELQASPTDAPDSLTATMLAYLESMAVAQLASTTVVSYARDFRLFVVWCEEREVRRPADVTRPLLERYQRHLHYLRKPNGQPLSVQRQYVIATELKQYFRWLVRQNLLLANPASDIQLPKLPRRLPRYSLTPGEVEKVVALPDVSTLVGLRDRAVLELLWATGLRRSEVAHLLIWDVQFERGVVFVREGKGRKDRVTPISGRALSWVRRYLDEARPRLAVSPDEGWLVLREAAHQLAPETLTHLVGGYIRAAGIDAKGSCHLFRHACATQMLEGGADIRFVQELLGHASLETTQVYTRVAISKLKAVYEATHPGARSAVE